MSPEQRRCQQLQDAVMHLAAVCNAPTLHRVHGVMSHCSHFDCGVCYRAECGSRRDIAVRQQATAAVSAQRCQRLRCQCCSAHLTACNWLASGSCRCIGRRAVVFHGCLHSAPASRDVMDLQSRHFKSSMSHAILFPDQCWATASPTRMPATRAACGGRWMPGWPTNLPASR